MMKIKCIFYDCVGPLLIKNTRIKVSPLIEKIDQLCGLAINDDKFWLSIQKKFNLTSNEVDKVADKIAGRYIKNEPMWDFHKKIRNRYKTAIINNGTSVVFRKWVKKFDMTKYFDELFNSSELGVRKPDKEIYKLCTDNIDVSLYESVLLDDSQSNVDGAISAGMVGTYYKPEEHQEFLSIVEKLKLV